MYFSSRKAIILGVGFGFMARGTLSESLAGPWSAPSGAGASFTYANGGDISGRFGDPAVVGNSFVFEQIDFVATAPEGGSSAIADTLSFDIFANPGLHFFGFARVVPYGSYDISGDPSSSVASASATLALDELSPSARHWEAPMVTNPPMPLGSGTGGWSGVAIIEFPQESPVTSFHFELSASLLAVSSPGGTSEIAMISGPEGFAVSFYFVPEPSALMLVTLAAVFILLPTRPRAMAATGLRARREDGMVAWSD